MDSGSAKAEVWFLQAARRAGARRDRMDTAYGSLIFLVPATAVER
jgi:hypothetical protein